MMILKNRLVVLLNAYTASLKGGVVLVYLN